MYRHHVFPLEKLELKQGGSIVMDGRVEKNQANGHKKSPIGFAGKSIGPLGPL
jgi:hypothetical protein